MGNCTSYGRTGSMRTAKLILLDGKLEEFSCPMKVSNLPKRNPDFFICNADEMEFDGLVSAVNGDEELQPGQLYFELPLIFLTHRLQAEDMASLAVKASVALSMRSEQQMNKYCYRPRRVAVEDPLAFFHEENVKVRSTTTPQADYCDLRLVKRRGPPAVDGAGKSKVSKFAATLSVILEAEE
ncbi:uncharacterized protein LOC113758736 [Coffea eugenioides]|uniref:Uncharacterized protein n=1 Tax=Coffea arabica TaxID=13443 RepID=A0A6P6W6J4_COFAR|nr:uncharacterized protein LOC113758651 [Coffea eugenioides]XP_027157271.1 uncharacterized protein LOC113758736 [Coffea eugenioides]